VRAGTTVVWINTGTQVHDVNAFDGSFASGALNPRQVFIFTFANPGRRGDAGSQSTDN
jgi:plastocyanin